MKYDDNSIHTTNAGVVVIYNGVQISTTKTKHHLFMCNHEALNCIEIFANNCVPGEEDQRIYVNAQMVISKLENGVLLEEFDRRMKELLRLNQIHDRSALLKDVTSRLVVNFLLDRIKIRDESPSPTLLHKSQHKRYSIFIEPKENDLKSRSGSADFQYESKPSKVVPATIVTSSAVVIGAAAEEEEPTILYDELNKGTIVDSPTLNGGEDGDDKIDDQLCEIKNRNHLIQRSRSRSTDSHDIGVGISVPPSDDWALDLDHTGAHTSDVGTHVESKNDDDDLCKEFTRPIKEFSDETDDQGDDRNELKVESVNESENTSRKTLTRKRSMSESDLYLKAAGLATLALGSVDEPVDAAGVSAVGIGFGTTRSSCDDMSTLRRGSTSSGKKMLIPLAPSDFKYTKDVPVDEKVPSYLAHTSSNYAKKLPPLRAASPSTAMVAATASIARPHTSDGNNSFRRHSTGHAGAVGRLQDLKQNGGGTGSSGFVSGHSSMKKSPDSVSGVSEGTERRSYRPTSMKSSK